MSIAFVVDLLAVNPDCCGLRRFFNSGLIHANKTWVKTFPGMDNRDMIESAVKLSIENFCIFLVYLSVVCCVC